MIRSPPRGATSTSRSPIRSIFNDNVELARLDTRVEFVQEKRRDYEAIYGNLLGAIRANSADAEASLSELASDLRDLDRARDDIDHHRRGRGRQYRIRGNRNYTVTGDNRERRLAARKRLEAGSVLSTRAPIGLRNARSCA
jgi:hypothetical protein